MHACAALQKSGESGFTESSNLCDNVQAARKLIVPNAASQAWNLYGVRKYELLAECACG